VCLAVVVAFLVVEPVALPVVLPVCFPVAVLSADVPVASAEFESVLLAVGDAVCVALGVVEEESSARTTSASSSGNHRGHGQAAVKVVRKRKIIE